MRISEDYTTAFPAEAFDASLEEAASDLDLEIALLATTAGQDAGEPTETVDLSALTPTEKQALLSLLRKSLGFGDAETVSTEPGRV